MQADVSRRDLVGMGLLAGGLAAVAGSGARAAWADGVTVPAEEPGTTEGDATLPDVSFGDVAALAGALESSGCTVQQGSLQLLDTLQMASQGKLVSCFGNNAGSYYLVTFLPPAPNQDPAAAVEERGWPAEEPSSYYVAGAEGNYPANPYFSPAGWSFKLRPDEAIVMAGTLPPACTYFSLINYVLLAAIQPEKNYEGTRGFFKVDGPQDVGSYHPIFGSLGMPLNQFNIATEATPGGLAMSDDGGQAPSFGARFANVITGDAATMETVRAALAQAGFGAGLINESPIPAATLNMGLEGGRDTFCTLGRISQPVDQTAMDEWLAALPGEMTVLRVTPSVATNEPFAAQPIVTRGTDVHETDVLPRAKSDLDALRAALIAQYAGEYDYEEPTVDIAVPEGMTAYLNDRNAQGDNHDTTYLMTSDFVLNSDEDFVAIYGVNHTATGKAVYSNAILYARPMLNGVASVYDGLFTGSAAAYLPEGAEDAGSYYVYKMARAGSAAADDFTVEIPLSTGNEQGKYYGSDNGETMLVAFRAYVERETGVGASYYEICWDRAIVFHKR